MRTSPALIGVLRKKLDASEAIRTGTIRRKHTRSKQGIHDRDEWKTRIHTAAQAERPRGERDPSNLERKGRRNRKKRESTTK